MSDAGDESRNVILVVDDQGEIRRMATTALSMAGFRAQVAENGQEGWECFLKHQDQICLIVTDVIMPVLNGLQLAEKIQEIDPKARILMMSAYSDVQLELQARDRFAFIRKPFLPQEFIEKIRRMLASGD